jgi:lyso-ornithine lipid O-acyltransferase
MTGRAPILVTVWRWLRFLEHVGTGVLVLTWVHLVSRGGGRPAWLPGVVQWWYRRCCRVFGMQVRSSGAIEGGCLLVCNHISWLDAIVLGAQGNVSFLSKAEVRRWPLIGWMADLVGTLFIARGAHQVPAITRQISERIARGNSLVIFPEGTTSLGLGVRRFFPPLFAIAQQPGLGVQPVALAYRRGADPRPDTDIAFVDDQSLIANLWRLLRHPGLTAQVQFLTPIRPGPEDQRRALSARARRDILAALGFPESAGLDAPPGRIRGARPPVRA